MSGYTVSHGKGNDTNLIKFKVPNLLKKMTNEELQKLGESITPQIVLGMLTIILADCINNEKNLGLVMGISTQMNRSLEIINKITDRDLEKMSEEKLNKRIADMLEEKDVA